MYPLKTKLIFLFVAHQLQSQVFFFYFKNLQPCMGYTPKVCPIAMIKIALFLKKDCIKKELTVIFQKRGLKIKLWRKNFPSGFQALWRFAQSPIIMWIKLNLWQNLSPKENTIFSLAQRDLENPFLWTL